MTRGTAMGGGQPTPPGESSWWRGSAMSLLSRQEPQIGQEGQVQIILKFNLNLSKFDVRPILNTIIVVLYTISPSACKILPLLNIKINT